MMIAEAQKRCTKCGETKPLSEFYFMSKGRGRPKCHSSFCKMCSVKRACDQQASRVRDCLGCGTSIRGQREYCQECLRRRAQQRKEAAKQTRKQKQSAKRMTRYTLPSWEFFVVRCCTECGSPFFCHPVSHQLYCSVLCNGRVQRRKRRIRKQTGETAVIELYRIAIRDRWTCQICREKVDMRATNYSSRPTMDHIVPLSRGGRHVRSNVQLAHFSCNSQKGARLSGPGTQLKAAGSF